MVVNTKNDSSKVSSHTPVLIMKDETVDVEGWETDTVSIDYFSEDPQNSITNNSAIIKPHTIILFVPGNPGCVGWYKKFLYSIVESLG